MQNFESARGDNFNLNLALVDGSSVAIDITGYAFELILKRRKEYTDDDARTITHAGQIDSAAGGLASIALDEADTADLTGTYFYRVKFTDADGGVHRALEGAMTFSEQVVGSYNGSATISVEDNVVTATVSNFSGASTTFDVDKFSRTAGTGYVTLSASQFAGTAVIPTEFPFRANSLSIFRNGVLMEKTAEYTEAVARTGFTFDPTVAADFDTTDKFEAKYVKN